MLPLLMGVTICSVSSYPNGDPQAILALSPVD